MSQCVPNWELDDHLLSHHHHHHAPLPSSGVATSVHYDVTELTWNVVDNLTTLGHVKPIPRYHSSAAAASAPAVGGAGALESIVDHARSGTHHSSAADAMVPFSVAGDKKQSSQGSATPAAAAAAGRKKSRPSPSAPPVGYEDEERCGGGGGGSPEIEKGSFTGEKPLGVDDHDSDNHHALNSQDELGARRITSSSVKRCREVAIHNQSERKRRDRINQKMKTLQKLLPNSCKTDKASMLDEVIEYLKLLQAQVQMMSRMNTIPTMMLPFSMQHQQLQQLQLSMLAQMTQTTRMAMSLGMIDPSLLNPAPLPPPILHPSTFPPLPSTAEWMQQPSRRLLPGMVPAFMGCQTQQLPMNSEAYSRMAALYQQLYQQSLGSNQKT